MLRFSVNRMVDTKVDNNRHICHINYLPTLSLFAKTDYSVFKLNLANTVPDQVSKIDGLSRFTI